MTNSAQKGKEWVVEWNPESLGPSLDLAPGAYLSWLNLAAISAGYMDGSRPVCIDLGFACLPLTSAVLALPAALEVPLCFYRG